MALVRRSARAGRSGDRVAADVIRRALGPRESVSIIGAGPAGLAAAIALARAGVPTVVYEQYHAPGGRSHGDLQGLENWSARDDILDTLACAGLHLDFPVVPVRAMTWADARLLTHRIATDRPLLYLVQRGSGADSLDARLAAQAAAAGVTFRFGARVRVEELAGPVIVATGPGQRSTAGVVAGIVARTPHPDQVVAIASDAIAPKGYAYCVIWAGRATLATVLMRDFDRARACLVGARRAFAELGLSRFSDIRPFGGRAHVGAADPLTSGSRLYVGEAAGLQDYLFGFGLRYAIRSGQLAAQALLRGQSYERLVAHELRGALKAGFVNRLLYNATGDRGHGWLIHWLGRPGSVGRRARQLYTFNAAHRALWPLARLTASRWHQDSLRQPSRVPGPSSASMHVTASGL